MAAKEPKQSESVNLDSQKFFKRKFCFFVVFVSLFIVCNLKSEATWYSDANWTKRIKISVNAAKINGSVLNFPVYIRMSDLPAGFFTDVANNGADLRVTKADGTTELAREVVFLNKSSNTGELHFVANGTMTNSANADFYLYYANPGATEPAANATYGKYNVWSPNYVAVWHLNESPTGTQYNSASSSYNCTSFGSMLSSNRVAGQLGGNGTSFDGSNDYLDCGDVNELDSVNKFTITGWAKRTNAGSSISLLEKFKDGNNFVSLVYYSIRHYAYIYGGPQSYIGANINDTSWRHSAMIYNGNIATAANRLSLYVNGTYIVDSPDPFTSTTANFTGNVQLGRSQAYNNYSDGRLDEIRISSEVLLPSLIKTEYNNQSSPGTFYSVASIESGGGGGDSTPPSVSSFSPVDNSTNTNVDANLIITFDEAVDIQTGNIYIKKLADDSTVQTIDITSGYVSGNGTTQITINPPNDLVVSNGYYVQIDATAFDDTAGNSYAGIANNSTWNFTTNSSPSWFNGDWHYRVKVSLNKAYINGTVANFPVFVNLAGLNGTSFFTYINSDGSDIVVTKSDGITRVAREVISINRTSKLGELYFVANGTLTNSTNGDFYIYYNNTLATEPAANGTYAKEKVWVNNYIGVWHLGSDPYFQASDSTSNNYDCTSYGGMNGNSLVPGQVGTAMLFNGTQQQYIDCGFSTALQSKTQMSLSAWFKRKTASSTIALGANHFSTGASALGIHSSAGNINSTVAGANAYGAYASNDTNWHQVHWLFNGASASGNSGRLRTYFDGVNVSLSYTGTVPATTYSSFNSSFTIGNLYSNPTNYYTNGYWDEVRISNTLRSNDWAKTEYNNLNSPSTFYSFATIQQVTDSKAPVLYSLSPSDNATGVRYNTHLILTFTEAVDTQAANIVIKKSSDNSTVQTIAANSSSVTGNGTTTLTINLNDLMSNNGYYIQIDSNAIKDLAGNAFAGINDTTTWNFTTQTIGAWFNGDWHYRVKINTIHNYINGDLSNFPIYVNLALLNGSSFFSNLNSDGSDIRVTKIDGTTEVAREIVFVDTSAKTGELYFVANGTNALSATYNGAYYIYYGNPLATEPTANGTYAKEKVWDSGYVGVWHLATDPSQRSFDSTSNNYDCTANAGLNGNNLVTGRIGSALLFNGTQSQYMNCGVANAIQNKTKIGISAWFKRRSASSNVSLGAALFPGSLAVGIYSPNSANVYSTVYGSTAYGSYASNDTSWHQLHMLFNGSYAGNASRLRTFFDGSQVSLAYTGSTPAVTHSDFSTYPFSIGMIYANSTQYFTNGYWDEVRLSNILRSNNWVKTEYNNLNSPSTFMNLSVETGNDTKAPVVLTLNPADNATFVRYNTNLTISFPEYVDTQAGNIYIKKSSDNSTVQTIQANSVAVSGNGTTTLTIDINDLMANNGYYVQIDSNAIKDLFGNFYAGINNTSSWNFTTHGMGNWFNGNWHYRIKINTNTNYVNGDLSNYPFYVDLSSFNGTNFFTVLNSDGSDIRVTKIDGTTEVAREVASINRTSKTGELYFQANGTLSKAYGDTFYIYYGNPLATEPSANGTYAKEKVWDSSYVGVWHSSEGSYSDSTSNNYDCTPGGGINGNNLITGRFGQALLFNGAQSQYLSCGVTTALNNKTKMSFSSWLKRRAAGSNVTAAARGGGSNDFGVYANNAGNITINLNVSTTPPYFASNDTNWHSVQFMFNGVPISNTSRLKVLYDGALQTMNYPGGVSSSTSTYAWPFTIGASGGLNNYTNGSWDEIRLSTASRGMNWLKTEYNNLSSPSTFYTYFAPDQYAYDVTAPAIQSLSPADNATNARTNSNLVLRFNDFVDIQTGTNLYIKKSSDNSTVQTISLSSAAVTGNGSSTLTIDINDLMSNNGYYIQIDNNAIKDLSGNAYAGINDTSTWNFTTRPTGNWFNGNWLYRTQIIINSNYVNGNSLTNFPIYVNLAHLASINFFNLTKTDGTDIRITKDDGTSEVAREVAYFNSTTNAGEMYFVANGSLSGTEDETFYIYYGNPSATEPTANGTYSKERVWNSGYLGVWHMTTDPSVKTYDSTSNNYDCSQSGSMTSADLVAGKVNYALSFDGSNDYVDCGITTPLQNKTAISISGWLKRRAASAVMATGASPNSGSASLGILGYSTNIYSAPYGHNNSGYNTNNDTSWHYVSWSFDGTKSTDATRLRTYIDAFNQAQTYWGSTPTNTYAGTFNYPFRIGYVYDSNLGGNMYSSGSWDEVRLSNVVRSDDWAKTEYNNLNSPSTFYSIGVVNKKGNPTVSLFSPADNEVDVAINSNLQITFDEAVSAQSGDIYIKKSSDDSTVETISANGPRVTLSNSNRVVTIDPTSNFLNNNGYYIQIDANAFTDAVGNGYLGIADTSTWNFTTVPIIANDWLQGGVWDKRLKIEINRSQINGSVTNFPVFVNLANLPATFFDDVANNGADLRLTKSDGVTQVAREVVFLNKTQNAGELHFIANGTLTNSTNGVFYLYYKNTHVAEPSVSSSYGKYNTWTQAGYAAVWHLNENPTGTLYNSASSSYNCTSYGSMLSSNRVTGLLSGNGTSFDGTNDYLDCDDITELNSVSKYSLTGWAKKNNVANSIALGTKYMNSNNNITSVLYSGNFYTYLSTGSAAYTSGGSLSDTSWHHISMVFNGNLSGNANRLLVYNNGNVLSPGYGGTIPATTAAMSGYNFWIGKDSVYAFFTTGNQDEVRISNLARSGSWIKTEYRNQASPSTFYSVSSITSYASPTLVNLSPQDNSTSSAVDENLVMTFDRNIDIQTGNVYIKKSSDNSTVETISVASGLVTGNGTNQITINPANDLARGNGYYVQIDASAFDDTGGNSYTGINDTTSWNFSTSYWYNGSWTKRIKVTVNSSSINGSVANFPVYLKLSDLPTAFYDDVLNNGADLRVTKGDGLTPVAREVVWLSKTQNAGELYFVANGAMTNAANTSFYIYYRNPYVTEPSANSTYGKYNTWAASGYVGVWHLNESPAGTLYNSASGSYNCTSYGTMTISNRVAGAGGLVGNGTSFDGSNDYLNCGDITQLNSTTKFTVTGWAKRTSSSAFVSLLNKYISSSSVLSVDFYSTTFYGLLVNSTGSTATATNNDTNWHHIAMIFNGNLSGNANRVNAYSDSALMSLSFSGTIPASTSNLAGANVYIGRDDYAGPYTNGRLDEVRVVNAARTGSWVKTEYNNQNSPSTFYTVSTIESIPDTVAPSVVTLSPADNATGVSAGTNLVITFDEPVDTQTGNIYIKKASDDSTVDTIVANSGSVTGNGTTQITVDPSVTLAFNTSYYVQIDAGAIKDTAGNSYAGISNTSDWNFSSSGWYSDNWTKRIPITINAAYVNGTVTNFPVYINLSDMPASFTNDVLANGADLRVTKSDGSTEVAREVVFLNRTTNAGELHFVANGTLTNSADTIFYIYYKNAAATEPAANATYGKYNTWAASNYVGVWHLNESPTGTLYNSASASYNCTSAGSMLSSNRVSGAGSLSGNGTSFDGSNDYLDCGDVNELDSVSKFTLSGWGKRTSSGSHVVIGAKYTNSSARVESWYFSDGNYYNIVGAGSYGYAAKNDTNWHHTVMIYNGNLSTNATRAVTYIDGAPLTHTYSGTIPTTSSNHSGNFLIGRSSASAYTNGRADEVRVSGLARTPNWAKTEYNNQNSPSTFYTIGSVDTMVDTTAPTISSLSPTDNSTNIDINTNLVITFNETIDTQSGNIYIKKSSDDSTVQTIAINSVDVSGNGTSILTINPPSDLAYNTSYYIQIASGAIKDSAGNSFTGIANTSTWNFSTVPQSPSDWLSGSLYRIKMTIDKNQINGSVARFPVYIDLNGLPAHFFTNVNNNGTDLRVTQSDGVSQLPREVVTVNKSATTGELYFLANGTLTNSSNGIFYLYYGNNSATEPSASSQYGRYAVWNGNTGYAAVYHFQQDPSTTIYNSVSASYNCSSSGGMSSALNKVASSFALGSNGYSFDGSNDYLDCGDVNELDAVTKFTVTGWAKRTSTGSQVVIADKYTDANNRMQSWYYSDGAYYGIVSSASAAYGSITKNDTNWHHTVMIYNGNLSGNANRVKVYFDGALSGSLSFTGTIPASSATYSGNLNIGRANAATYTNGRIDEVRISRVARNGSWIKTEYNNQSAPNSFASFASYQDLTSPSLLTVSPADNSSSIATNTNLVLSFERSMDVQTGNIYIKKLSDNSTVQTIDVTSGAITGNGTTQITVNPPSDLGALTAYYINIDATAFDDTAGNSYAGMTGNGTWNFTTAGDSTAPTISSFSPTDNAAGVSVSANLVMNFSENIDIQTGNLVIYNNGGSVFETIDVTSGALSGNGSSAITINPTSNFADYSSYYVLVNSGVFKDLAGNSYAGISTNTIWNFTTNDLNAPTVMNYSPAHTSILQQRYAGLRIVFNEVVQKGAGTIVIKQVSDNSTVASVNISDASVVVTGNQLYVQMPQKLSEGIEFYIQISSGAVKDLSNNDYAGIANTTTWRFFTSPSENSLFL